MISYLLVICIPSRSREVRMLFLAPFRRLRTRQSLVGNLSWRIGFHKYASLRRAELGIVNFNVVRDNIPKKVVLRCYYYLFSWESPKLHCSGVAPAGAILLHDVVSPLHSWVHQWRHGVPDDWCLSPTQIIENQADLWWLWQNVPVSCRQLALKLRYCNGLGIMEIYKEYELILCYHSLRIIYK